jgi:hypothetical protein
MRLLLLLREEEIEASEFDLAKAAEWYRGKYSSVATALWKAALTETRLRARRWSRMALGVSWRWSGSVCSSTGEREPWDCCLLEALLLRSSWRHFLHGDWSFSHVQDDVFLDWDFGDVLSSEKCDSPGLGNGLKW